MTVWGWVGECGGSKPPFWKKIAYGESAKKVKKKTKNSVFSATHTYIKLTLSFFLLFFCTFPLGAKNQSCRKYMVRHIKTCARRVESQRKKDSIRHTSFEKKPKIYLKITYFGKAAFSNPIQGGLRIKKNLFSPCLDIVTILKFNWGTINSYFLFLPHPAPRPLLIMFSWALSNDDKIKMSSKIDGDSQSTAVSAHC